MNFLSHYYLDRIDKKPYHNFGLILPDLMSMYKRKWKVSEKAMKFNLNQNEAQIVTGVLKHNNLDSFFHGSDFFNKYTTIIKGIFQKNHIGYPEYRIHFVAHIFLELIIDRVIIKKDRNILDEYYKELNQIDWEVLKSFFEKIEIHADEGFLGYFTKFIRRKYLYKYTNDYWIIFITNRILQKVNLPLLTDQKKSLKRSIKEIETILLNSYFEITSLKSRMIIHNYLRAV